jgi:hypothetical protein
MAGRSDVQRSVAHRAMSDGGRKVLHAVEAEVRRGGGAITLEQLMELTDLCRSSVRRGVRQCEELGFAVVTMGPRRANLFQLSDGWRAIDTDEAERLAKQSRLPTPPRQTSAPAKPVRPVKARVEQPPVEQPPPPRQPSMPVVAWIGR